MGEIFQLCLSILSDVSHMRKTNVLWLMPTQEPWWWKQSIKLFGLLRDHYSIHKQESWQKKKKKQKNWLLTVFAWNGNGIAHQGAILRWAILTFTGNLSNELFDQSLSNSLHCLIWNGDSYQAICRLPWIRNALFGLCEVGGNLCRWAYDNKERAKDNDNRNGKRNRKMVPSCFTFVD